MKYTAQFLKDHGLHGTYWGKAIIKAEIKGEFSKHHNLMANDWPTCACGKNDPRLMDGDDGPYDSELRELGLDFGLYIDDDDFFAAASCLLSIEKRAITLLQAKYA